jgi:polysaccharide chain length determinant protein (PEP-CTERM system associated)
MPNIPKIELRPYLEMALRRKWWIVVPVFLVLIAGWLYYKNSPKIYLASTLILVESQRVPQEFVPSTVTDDLTARLGTITQQVHSRTNLEQIIQRFELYPSQEESTPGFLSKVKSRIFVITGLSQASEVQDESDGPSMQGLVQNVRNKITIDLRPRNQGFEISFKWNDPVVAARVANALASQFIDQNLRVREEMAVGTTRFLDVEVQRLQEELQTREIALENFKRQHMGSLPSQLQSNLNILIQLKEELGRVEEQAQQIMYEIQLARRLHASADQGVQPFEQESALAREIRELEESLKQMRVRYTEQHPEIQALKRRLEQLQQEQDLAMAEAPYADQTQFNRPVNRDGQMRQIELEQAQRRLSVYESRINDLRRQIRIYEQRVEETSEVELNLRNLERDYNAVNERFQTLLRRKLDAELSEQMERRQQGEQFRVVDQAIPPDRPFSPDRNRIMLLSLFIGLGMGGGLAYLRESLDSAFYSAAEVEQTLKPEVLISLPYIEKIRKGRKYQFGGKS